MTVEELLDVIETDKVIIVNKANIMVDIEDTKANTRKKCKEYMSRIVLFAVPVDNGIEITIKDM